jgi:3-oxoacyl-[acyl-carrier protein] reductase
MSYLTALVTGGNRGIGLATTRALLDLGLRVVVVARAADDALFAGDSGARVVPFDLTDTDAIPSLIAEVGPVDVLVNNAGVMLALPLERYTTADIDRVLRLNLTAPVALTQAVSSHMIAQGRGRVINVASIAGQIGHPDVWYGASKAALLNATKSFAKLLGPYGVQVNAVAPGPVETDMLASIPAARKAAVLQNTVSGRAAQPAEVAATIAWLATAAPAYLNGVCLDLNDGAVLR